MFGSFDECKGSASLLQNLQHSLPMTAKIVHETFLLYLVIFFIQNKNRITSLPTTYKNTQKSCTIQENGLEIKLQPSKKRFLSQKRAFSSISTPSFSLETQGASSPHCPQSTPLRLVLQTKDSAFGRRDSPSVERSATMGKNSSAFTQNGSLLPKEGFFSHLVTKTEKRAAYVMQQQRRRLYRFVIIAVR